MNGQHIAVGEWSDIARADGVGQRDKQRVATIFSEDAWDTVIWLPDWILEDSDKDLGTVEASDHIAVGDVEDYSEKAWQFVQPHRKGDPGGYLPKSQVVVFERVPGVETIETPQHGLSDFGGDT